MVLQESVADFFVLVGFDVYVRVEIKNDSDVSGVFEALGDSNHSVCEAPDAYPEEYSCNPNF